MNREQRHALAQLRSTIRGRAEEHPDKAGLLVSMRWMDTALKVVRLAKKLPGGGRNVGPLLRPRKFVNRPPHRYRPWVVRLSISPQADQYLLREIALKEIDDV